MPTLNLQLRYIVNVSVRFYPERAMPKLERLSGVSAIIIEETADPPSPSRLTCPPSHPIDPYFFYIFSALLHPPQD